MRRKDWKRQAAMLEASRDQHAARADELRAALEGLALAVQDEGEPASDALGEALDVARLALGWETSEARIERLAGASPGFVRFQAGEEAPWLDAPDPVPLVQMPEPVPYRDESAWLAASDEEAAERLGVRVLDAETGATYDLPLAEATRRGLARAAEDARQAEPSRVARLARELDDTRALVDRLKREASDALAQRDDARAQAVAAEQSKDTVTRFLRDRIGLALDRNIVAGESGEILRAALRDAYDPDEIPF